MVVVEVPDSTTGNRYIEILAAWEKGGNKKGWRNAKEDGYRHGCFYKIQILCCSIPVNGHYPLE